MIMYTVLQNDKWKGNKAITVMCGKGKLLPFYFFCDIHIYAVQNVYYKILYCIDLSYNQVWLYIFFKNCNMAILQFVGFE